MGALNKMRTFDELLKDAMRAFHAAEDCWQAWWFYVGEDTPATFFHAFDLYPWLVDQEIHAHFVATVMALGKLYDSSNDAVSLSSLFREARVQNAVCIEVLAAIRADRKKASKIWSRLKVIRDENVAHVLAEEDFKEVFERANIKYEKVEELICLSRNVLNRLCEARNTGQWFPDYHVRKDITKLWESVLIARAEAVNRRTRYGE
ncbi:MAG: hypothetical protein WAM82_36710 [Thermoanaerobaculia bacterium]